MTMLQVQVRKNDLTQTRVVTLPDTPLAVMIIAAREKDQDQPAYKKFVQAYQSDSVKKFIAEKYKGTIEPSWD